MNKFITSAISLYTATIVTAAFPANDVASPQPVDKVSKEMRIIHDLARFTFRRVAEMPGSTWVVAKTSPGPTSGTIYGLQRDVTTNKIIIDEKTGKPAVIDNARVFQAVTGQLEIIDTLASPGVKKRDFIVFNFEKKISLYKGGYASLNSLRPFSDAYAPFEEKGSLIANLPIDVDEQKGIPTSSYAIPTEWAADVLPSFKDYQAIKAVLVYSDDAEVRAKQRILLQQARPLLRIDAYNVLVAENDSAAYNLETLFAQSSSIEQAVFLYSALTSARINQSKIVQRMSRIVDGSTSVSQLKSIVAGVLAANRVQIQTGRETIALSSERLKERFELLTLVKRKNLLAADSDYMTYLNEELLAYQQTI